MDTLSLRAFGGWNAFEVVDEIIDREYNVTWYIYGASAEVYAGPVTIKLMGWGGQNVDLYGLTNDPEVDFTPDYVAGVDSVRDNDGFGSIASIGLKINDIIGVEAGYGYVRGEDAGLGKDDHDEAWAAYLQAPLTLADGVTIVPEVGRYDFEESDANADEGYKSYFGAKWQINF